MDTKNIPKKIALRTKKHVQDHKVAYAVGVTSMVMLKLHMGVVKDFYRFLGEKGIDPMEFYSPEFYKELHK